MAHQGDFSLDVAEPQILLSFPNDAGGFFHHHRLLITRLGPGRWIAATPDHDLEVVDLNGRAHRILQRRSPLPADIIDEIYAFDEPTRQELENLRRQAKTMAVILGDDDLEEVAAQLWVFSDSDSKHLGKAVSEEQMRSAVFLGGKGLVEVDGEVETIQEIDQAGLDMFVEKKRSAMGDLRLIGHHVDSHDKRFLHFKEAFPLLRQSELKDWSFAGPRAVREFLGSINESGVDLGGYHLQWVKNSGVNQHTSVVHEHRNLLEVIRLALTRDQLDISNLLSMELVVRRVVQLEVAVARNSSSPDYSGLEVLLDNPLSEGGAANTRSLDEWVTSRLKEKAQIAKQNRLYREEVSHAAKGKNTYPADGEQGDGKWRKRRPKAKPKAGAESSGAAS